MCQDNYSGVHALYAHHSQLHDYPGSDTICQRHGSPHSSNQVDHMRITMRLSFRSGVDRAAAALLLANSQSALSYLGGSPVLYAPLTLTSLSVPHGAVAAAGHRSD
jgi:hypothetical protein